VIAGRDLGGHYWELLICDEVGNLLTTDDSGGYVSETGGSSEIKMLRDVMKLWEDLERQRLLNELDDVITSNGVNGR